ncbi:MAG: hypothetical protein IE909_09980, partial [Campylobacterales bacterium]|nr:hypothetical protein [Campylobacterales bacterium]
NNTAHTARLSFGTAVSLLELGIELSKETIEIELVRQYLWLHAGQRSSLWGYINHLRKHHNLELPSLEDKQTYDLKLQRPKESIERCKQKLISFLRAKTFSRDDYLELALAYYHRLKLPDELFPLRAQLGQDKGDWIEVKLSKDKFLIPKLTVSE